MAKACAICGKGSFSRVNGRHKRGVHFSKYGPFGLKGVKTNQTVKPNFREIRLAKGTQKVLTCMSCYKSIKESLVSSASK